MRASWGALLAVTLGCGSSTAGNGGATGSAGAGGLPAPLAAELDAFADAYAHAWCDGLAACCHFWPFHQDVCLANARLAARQGVALGAAPTFARPIFNAGARDVCLAQVRQIVASCPATTFPETPAPQCGWVFTKGASPAGGSCQNASDCAPPSDRPPVCLNGSCTVEMFDLAAGASCGGPYVHCADTLACEEVMYTCGPKIALGKRCAYDSDCVAGAYCNGVCAFYTALGAKCSAIVECGPNARCASGVCQPFVATGGACTDSSACAAADHCEPTTKVCTTRVPIGQPCPYEPTGNDEPCADGGSCLPTSGTLLKAGDMSPFVCVPKHLPLLCFTG